MGGNALSDYEKVEDLANSVETQFQPVNDPSVLAVIEIVEVALRSYFLPSASEPNLTNPEEVQEAVRCLKVGKPPGPNCIPYRAFKHLLPASCIPSCPVFQCVPLHPSLPYSVEACSCYAYP